MRSLPIFGWQAYGVSRHRHFCGARVILHGGKWKAIFVDRSSHTGFNTAQAGVHYIEREDSDFWTFDGLMSRGWLGGVYFETSFLEGDRTNRAFTISLKDKEDLIPSVQRIFKKHLYWKATCARCWKPMTQLALQPKIYFGAWGRQSRSGKGMSFFVCDCGYPVWRGDAIDIEMRISRSIRNKRRQQLEKEAEGAYTPEDITKLLVEQNGRCFYCDVLFCADTPYSVDHIEPLTLGGSHWPDNLCLACRNCNFTKRDQDLLEFVYSLAPAKRKKALKNIAVRFPFIIEAIKLFG